MLKNVTNCIIFRLSSYLKILFLQCLDAPVIKDSVRHAVDQLRTEVSEVAEDLKQRFNHLPEDLKDRFYRLQGQLFHAVRTINGANYMYRYRY